jgi:hypothetical protein
MPILTPVLLSLINIGKIEIQSIPKASTNLGFGIGHIYQVSCFLSLLLINLRFSNHITFGLIA